MQTRPDPQPRAFRGFVALERAGGAMLWGTLRPTAAEAEAVFRKWNPMQEPQICAVRLAVEGANLTDRGARCEE
jgi:hypothetical protein